MKFASAISDFLYDKDYFITICRRFIHIYRYKKLEKLTKEEIILKMDDFDLIIKGSNLIITKMSNEEIQVEGNIITVGKSNE